MTILGFGSWSSDESVLQNCTNSGTMTPKSDKYNGLIGGVRDASHVRVAN